MSEIWSVKVYLNVAMPVNQSTGVKRSDATRCMPCRFGLFFQIYLTLPYVAFFFQFMMLRQFLKACQMCAGAASSSQDVTGVSQARFRKLLLVLESIRSPSLGHHRKTSHCLTTTFMAQKVSIRKSMYMSIYIYIYAVSACCFPCPIAGPS